MRFYRLENPCRATLLLAWASQGWLTKAFFQQGDRGTSLLPALDVARRWAKRRGPGGIKPY
jgi:hypothetical protein